MLGISIEILTAQVGRQIASVYWPIFNKELAPAGINTKNKQCAFLAQVISEGLKKSSENLNYSAELLMKNWKFIFKTLENAKTYEYKPELIANTVYGRKGNILGNDKPGDGWKYRGRGPIGITGKWCYGACGKAMGLDLITHPELLEQPEPGVESAIWFWNWKKLSPYAEAGEIDKVSRGINHGDANSEAPAIHEKERRDLYNYLLKYWKV